jgi:hypothetical protein
MEKPILLVAFDTLGSFLVIIIILKTRFFRNIEDTIIANHISARDIVSHSNLLIWKTKTKITDRLPSLSQAFFQCHIIGKTNRDEIQNQMRLKFARKLQKRNVTEKSRTSYSQKWLSNVN